MSDPAALLQAPSVDEIQSTVRETQTTQEPPPTADEIRKTYLAENPIAIGPPGDPQEFRREYERFKPLLPKRTPLRVLDIGCGTGAWSVHWAALGCRVTGADLDPDFIARAHRREGLNEPGRFQGIVADATRLPRNIGNFDVVSLNSLLEHVPDWYAAVSEAVRMLAPGGLLLLHTTNRHHPFQGEVNHFPFYSWLPGPIRDRVLAWIMKHRRDLVNYTDYPAVHWFSYPQLAQTLRDMNLEVYDRLDLMNPAQMTGVRALGRWMLPGRARPARGKFLFYLASPTVSLYARRPAEERARDAMSASPEGRDCNQSAIEPIESVVNARPESIPHRAATRGRHPPPPAVR